MLMESLRKGPNLIEIDGIELDDDLKEAAKEIAAENQSFLLLTQICRDVKGLKKDLKEMFDDLDKDQDELDKDRTEFDNDLQEIKNLLYNKESR